MDEKIHSFNFFSENEETEGSEGQAEYMFGDAELDDDDLYSMEHDNQTGQSQSLLSGTKELPTSVPAIYNLLHAQHSFVCYYLCSFCHKRRAGVHAAPGGLPAAPRDCG